MTDSRHKPGRGQLDLGFGSGGDVVLAWSVPLLPRKLACRFQILRTGACISVEAARDFGGVVQGSEPLWHVSARLVPPVSLSGSLVESDDFLPDDWDKHHPRSSVLWRAVEGICLRAQVPQSRLQEARDSACTVHQHLNALVTRCDRHEQALALAHRFARGEWMAWFVFRSAMNDSSGRLAQMVEVCPGLLLMAGRMETLGMKDESGRIVSAILSARPLNRLVAETVAVWAATTGTAGNPLALANQRVRIRRAAPRVPPGLLWRPCGEPITLEDIPANPDDNAFWFTFLASLEQAMDDIGPDPARRAPLFALASKQARRLATALAPDTDWSRNGRDVIRGLIDYLVASQRALTRESNPERLVRDSAAWRAELQERMARAPSWHAGPLRSSAIEVGGCERWCLGEARVWLLTVEDLQDEGQKMRSCVGSYQAQAMGGHERFFHARTAKSEATIRIRDRYGNLAIEEIGGPGNRRVSMRMQQIVLIWLADMNEVRRSRTERRTANLKGSFVRDFNPGRKASRPK